MCIDDSMLQDTKEKLSKCKFVSLLTGQEFVGNLPPVMQGDRKNSLKVLAIGGFLFIFYLTHGKATYGKCLSRPEFHFPRVTGNGIL